MVLDGAEVARDNLAILRGLTHLEKRVFRHRCDLGQEASGRWTLGHRPPRLDASASPTSHSLIWKVKTTVLSIDGTRAHDFMCRSAVLKGFLGMDRGGEFLFLCVFCGSRSTEAWEE